MNVPQGFNGLAFEADHGVVCWVEDGELKTSEPVANFEQKVAENVAKYGPLAAKEARQIAFQKEADPLFFAWQRGENTEQAWIDKVAEIRARYPYPA